MFWTLNVRLTTLGANLRSGSKVSVGRHISVALTHGARRSRVERWRETRKARKSRDKKKQNSFLCPFGGCVSRRLRNFHRICLEDAHITLICCSDCLSASELSVARSPRCTVRSWWSCGVGLSFCGPREAAASLHKVLRRKLETPWRRMRQTFVPCRQKPLELLFCFLCSAVASER